MSKILFAAGVAAFLLIPFGANAADVAAQDNRDNGLLFGGTASVYLGYVFLEEDEVDVSDAETPFIGGRGALSIPIMDMFSIQFDALGERTLDKNDDDDQTIGDLTLAAHASYRDPEAYLVGLFGGGGWTFDHGDDDEGNMHFYFIGAEAQYYWNNFTLYGQAGFLDGEDFYLEIPEMAWFGRGAVSYYYTPDTKITGELSYLSGDRRNNTPDGPGELDVFSWGAKIQHLFETNYLPGPAGISLAYNGYDFRATDESDSPLVHEFRIGFDIVLGSPSLIDNDRRAAGLDLPPINRWISVSANEIE